MAFSDPKKFWAMQGSIHVTGTASQPVYANSFVQNGATWSLVSASTGVQNVPGPVFSEEDWEGQPFTPEMEVLRQTLLRLRDELAL